VFRLKTWSRLSVWSKDGEEGEFLDQRWGGA